MNTVGYLIASLGIYSLYQGNLVLGGIIFFIGGFLASKISFCLRSTGVMILLITSFYGYHNEFSPVVFLIMLIGFVLACFNTQRTSDKTYWGIDLNYPTFKSDSSSGCGSGDIDGD